MRKVLYVQLLLGDVSGAVIWNWRWVLVGVYDLLGYGA